MLKVPGIQAALTVIGALLVAPRMATADPLTYTCSSPTLEVTFRTVGGHYNGAVTCGNLFLQADIPNAPTVRWAGAKRGKLYLLMMIDFDGNALGSWPDRVPNGANSPVRHWLVANIPGDLLRGVGYEEAAKAEPSEGLDVLQPYRSPHIPVVSDRYAVYLFEQDRQIHSPPLSGAITNFDDASFRQAHHLSNPLASNYFVVVYTSESPFSGSGFHGNDVSSSWHKDYGMGKLTP
jgi:phosphatidylethanolamine-binding protein (PEBP) family uncharacterized protein